MLQRNYCPSARARARDTPISVKGKRGRSKEIGKEVCEGDASTTSKAIHHVVTSYK